MKAFKKILCVLTALIIIAVSVVPAFAVELTDLTFLYIDKGDITIGDGTVSGYGYQGQRVTRYNPNGYCITMAGSDSTSNAVIIDGGENYIAFKNINIIINGDYNCAFRVQNGAKADIWFTGKNVLRSGRSRAGLEISQDSTVTLSGDGTLTAQSTGQAGIGGGSGAANGTVIINSGTIMAECLSESAGIGGGSSGAGGNIIINGGNVRAIGGSNAAGIGGGSAGNGGNITINGGTVTATGGENGAGIGGGWYGYMGNVVINGGSVKAVGGSSAPSIGAGNGFTSANGPVNSEGEEVYLCTVNSASLGDVSGVCLNGRDALVCGTHKDDSNYYFYLPSGTNFISVANNQSSEAVYKFEISSSGSSSYRKVEPVNAVNGADIGVDNVIRGITCGLTDLNDYLDTEDGYSLSYDNEFMGTGTHVTVMYGEIPVCTYRTLLYGDMNNDGFYDGEDSFMVLLVLWDMLTSSNTDALVLEAADADRDGYITAYDMYLLDDAGLLRASVSQETGTIRTDSYEEYVLLIDQTPLKRTYAPSQEETEEIITDEITVESESSILDFIIKFIKIAIKIFSSVHSFWKNYFI